MAFHVPLGFMAVGRTDLERIWAVVSKLTRDDPRPAVINDLLYELAGPAAGVQELIPGSSGS